MPASLFRPWRSVWLPRIVTAVSLFAGLPLYLRMPLWCDLTLYDLAARNILAGGMHYRDVFDTNLPGFVWVLASIRALVGFGAFPLRCVDLAIVVGIVLLLDQLAKRGGATVATRWWAIAAYSLLYPFASEMVHCQRDTWMALPVLAAVVLRLRRLNPNPLTPSPAREEGTSDSPSHFWGGFGEGCLWALAVWIKPHVVLMAASVWLFTTRRLAATSPTPWRAFAADLLGNLLGGLMLGVAGIAYLMSTGTWSEFWHIITVWGPEYTELGRRELEDRSKRELHWFPPWSLWLLPTLPLALLSMLDAVPWAGHSEITSSRPGLVGRVLPSWLWDCEAGPAARFTRATLAVLWLVWAFQAFYIQRGFVYAHLPETFFMVALWVSHRWAMPFIAIVWLLITGVAWVIADSRPDWHAKLEQAAIYHSGPRLGEPDQEHYIMRHPLFDLNRMRWWGDCWRFNLTDHERYVLWDRIKRVQEHEASPGWEELDEVAGFFRSQGVKDGEVIAWHDSPHVIYLMMHLRPGVRYMHTNTAMVISRRAELEVITEMSERAKEARFALADLDWAVHTLEPAKRPELLGPPTSPTDLLPSGLQATHRNMFPFDHRSLFRTRGGLGRYIVYQLRSDE